MNKEDIIRMGLEAGMRFYCDSWTVEDDPDSKNPKQISTLHLQRFAKLVAQHEREACAIVGDDINAKYKWPDDVAERVASQWCADSIRARGQA
jgi:hypothetical protein